MKQVKKIISGFVSLFLVVLAMGINFIYAEKAQAAGEVLVSVAPSVFNVSPGESFTVDVVVDPQEINNIITIQTNFEFNPSLVQVNSVVFRNVVEDPSLGWSDDCDPPSGWCSPGIDNNTGLIGSYIIAYSAEFPNPFPSTSFTLLTINMTAKTGVSGASYLRLPSDTVFYFDGASYTDNTIEAQSSGGTLFDILTDTNDFLYIGLEQKFDSVDFSINGRYYGGQDYGEGLTLSAEYYSTNWSPLAIISDSTSNLSFSDGYIAFAPPSDWAQNAVNGVARYWVRLKTTTAPTNIPKARSIHTPNTIKILEFASSDYLSFLAISGSIIVNVSDTTSPTIASITSSHINGSFKAGEVIDIDVIYNEAVNVVTTGGTPTLALNSSGSAVYNSGAGTNTLTFRYTVVQGDNSGDLDYSATNSLALNGGTIKDAAGNDAILTLPAVGAFAATHAIAIDTVAPAAISTLATSSPTTSAITLTWTAPGDNGSSGTATSYDIRYSTNTINDANWASATQASGEPTPQIAGTSQSITITNLSSSTTYYFAVKTSDAALNESALSNIAAGTTQSAGGGGGGGGGYIPPDTTPPAKATDFTASAGDGKVVLAWKNPSASDFAGTKVLRKEDSYPTSVSDGKLIYGGKETTYTDTGLTNKTAYYYSAFTYDNSSNYSAAVTASAIPEEGKIPPSDYPDGALLKALEDPKIYVIIKSKKKWIETAEEFAAGGYRWENVKTISASELAAIPDYTGSGIPTTYPDGALLKIPESFKIYVIISQKKKWIPTPEVFETLGYKWGSITVITKADLDKIPDYEDNLIRTIGDYKVYLVVNGIKRHIPNPEIFLNYGFGWGDVKDVSSAIVDKYQRAYLIRESRQGKIYYLDPREIKKHIPSPEVFASYGNKWEDIQVISKKEMDSYPESNLARLEGDNRIYLIEGTAKRWIPSAEVFNAHRYGWNSIISINKAEFDYYREGKRVQ